MEPTRFTTGDAVVDRRGRPPCPYPRLSKFERLSGRRADVAGLITFLDDAARLATQITEVDGCCEISLVGSRSRPAVRASSDVYASVLGTIQHNLGEGPCPEAFRTALAYYVPDFRTEHRWLVFTLAARTHGFGSMLAQPLIGESGTTIGTLALYSRRAEAYPPASLGQIADLAMVVTEVSRRPRPPAPDNRTTTAATTNDAADPTPGSYQWTHQDTGDQLEITCSERDGLAVVAVTGDVDIAAAPQLRHELLRLLWRRPGRLIVALDQVPFMDAAGLRTISVVSRYAHLTGTPLRIAGPRHLVQKMFTLTGMDKTLAIFPTLTDAIDDTLLDTPHTPPAS